VEQAVCIINESPGLRFSEAGEAAVRSLLLPAARRGERWQAAHAARPAPLSHLLQQQIPATVNFVLNVLSSAKEFKCLVNIREVRDGVVYYTCDKLAFLSHWFLLFTADNKKVQAFPSREAAYLKNYSVLSFEFLFAKQILRRCNWGEAKSEIWEATCYNSASGVL